MIQSPTLGVNYQLKRSKKANKLIRHSGTMAERLIYGLILEFLFAKTLWRIEQSNYYAMLNNKKSAKTIAEIALMRTVCKLWDDILCGFFPQRFISMKHNNVEQVRLLNEGILTIQYSFCFLLLFLSLKSHNSLMMMEDNLDPNKKTVLHLDQRSSLSRILEFVDHFGDCVDVLVARNVEDFEALTSVLTKCANVEQIVLSNCFIPLPQIAIQSQSVKNMYPFLYDELVKKFQ